MSGFSSTSRMARPRFYLEVLWPYAAVVLSTLLAAGMVSSGKAAGYPVPAAPVLLLPVLVGVFFGGWGGGLVALVLGLVADGLLFREMAFSEAPMSGWDTGSSAVGFVAGGLLLCLAGHWLRRLGQRTRDAAEAQRALEREISHRRELEERLIRSQQAARTQLAEMEGIYAAAPIGLALVDRELRFARVNGRWSEITGLAPREHLGRTLREAAPHLAGFLESLARRVLDGHAPILDREVSAGPGGERVWLASFVPATAADGRAGGVHIAVREITGQKRCERALGESEEKFRLMAESLPHGLWITDPAGTAVFANHHWLEFTGLGPEAADDWLSVAHPDDRERAGGQYLAARRDGSRFEAEVRLRSGVGGEYRWHGLCARPLGGWPGGAGNWLVVAGDVHEARSAQAAVRAVEARLSMALEAGRMAAFETDGRDGSTRWLDPDDLRASMALEGPLQSWIEALRPGDGRRTSGSAETEFQASGADGRARWVQVRVRHPDAGAGGGLVGVVADVTERRRFEADLLRSRAALREADRRKDEFLAVLTHELRNPLAPILTSAQLLRRRGLERPELLESATGSIERQVKHLSRMIGDLSDISRIARGKIELKPEILEVDTIASQAVEACRPLLDKRRQELYVELPEQPLYVRGDPARLAQVIGNLLGNASQFTPAGGNIHLAVETDGRSASIGVRDEGIGIDPAALDRLFEPFVQLERPLHGGHVGLGIGLALAKPLVEMHGGEIQVRSEGKGKGSEFVVRLPLAEAEVSRRVAEARGA